MKKQQMLPEQDQAANPTINVRVQANAGTGKTFVLVQRLLRIMFREDSGSRGTVLCLTYTNAGAAEMKDRILAALRNWAVANDEDLRDLLFGVSSSFEPTDADLSRARAIFYEFIDAPKMLKIQTIHGFCEEILRKYPVESGINPSWRLVSGAEQKRLLKESFAEFIHHGDEKIQIAFDIVMDHVSEHYLDDLTSVLIGEYRRFFSLKQNIDYRQQFIDSTKNILKPCDAAKKMFFAPNAVANRRALEQIIIDDLNKKSHTHLSSYLQILQDFNNGKIDFSEYKIDGRIKREYMDLEKDLTNALKQENLNNDIYQSSIAFFDLCDAFADKYLEIKRIRGLLDFDDLLLYTKKLFSDPSKMGWVLSSLDSNLRHILVDEAQDTSPEQWDILTSLTSDFGVVGDAKNPRSLFVVGDTKQSIYSFQGASPEAFAKSINQIKAQVQNNSRDFSELTLAQSFRSTAPILQVIDYVFDDISTRNLSNFINNSHKVFRVNQSGFVEFHPLSQPDKVGEENIDIARKKYVKTIANKIKSLIESGAAKSSDIMVLVQRRKPFASLLVNELKCIGVPVAGSDRIVLPEFPAIKDFLNLIRFVVDNTDDYSLACVLKSPLFRFNEVMLYQLCRDKSISKQQTLFQSLEKSHSDIYKELFEISNAAQTLPPYSFFIRLLNENNRREKIIAVFGAPVIDPLEEFLTICLSYERTQPGMLKDFIEWFMQGESEIRRDLETDSGVRVMTIHSSKGLEAPIVFLIDTFRNPKSPNQSKVRKPIAISGGGLIWRGSSESSDIYEEIENDELQLKMQEYYRLLYVAMTRPRDQLYIYGFRGDKESGAELSWHKQLSSILPSMPGVVRDDNGVIRLGEFANNIKDSNYKNTEPLNTEKVFIHRPQIKMNNVETFVNMDTIAMVSDKIKNKNYAIDTGLLRHSELQFIDIFTDYPIDSEMNKLVSQIKSNPNVSQFFISDAKTELPIAGIINGKFQSRRIDRMIVRDDEIMFLDYKSDVDKNMRREHYESQLCDYAKLLSLVYPNHKISGFILWLHDWTLEKIIG